AVCRAIQRGVFQGEPRRAAARRVVVRLGGGGPLRGSVSAEASPRKRLRGSASAEAPQRKRLRGATDALRAIRCTIIAGGNRTWEGSAMRIVLGLWLLQAFSAGSAWLAFAGGSRGEILALIGLAMSVGLLAALWFCSAMRDQRRLGEARQLELMASRAAALQADLARQRAADTAKLRALTEKISRPQRRLLKVSL